MSEQENYVSEATDSAVDAEMVTSEAVETVAEGASVSVSGDPISSNLANNEEVKAEVVKEGEEKEEKKEEKKKVVKGGLPPLDEERSSLPWYVVHTYSGFEQRVKVTLEERIKTANLVSMFGNIIVPQEKIVELVRGEKKTSSRKVFPGYILVQCNLNEESWHLVKATPKVTGFIGDSNNPVPLAKEEVENLLRQMEGVGHRPRPSVQFEQGDSVKVVDGPFADFNGTIDEVKPDKGKVRVLISIFGRNTPVELDFVQVEKV